ncbi:Retrovirus-related Pol poly from transposon TNT 1-94 [Olea europaea subsp. europaea]|uniref:Retrovirus-related Pol poly from transposon TNT 1-94 n=1 Tax=Olea europaea subsp. europaea TaxID=158383 RepID=A0A8S0R6E6_OLEEU|nr:Retrovirus-related Pol poly from transposon TNT 1-94 [Olea europaea subsp. europaea]
MIFERLQLVACLPLVTNRHAQGLFVRGRSNVRPKGKGEKSRSSSRPLAKRSCFKCGELGHFKANCPNKKGWKKNNKNNISGKVQVKQEVSYASEGGESDECYAISCDEETSGKWILDSGYSYHMCPNRKWFTTYRSTDGGTVLMGNNHSCKTVGLGSIRIKMHDGVIRTLIDVRHVPDLRKNLISVGALDSGGCKIVTWNGVKKVVRGSLIVMKGIREGNLYALRGTTVTEDVAVGTSGSGGDPCECTRLWHRRLGHMSEKGLDLLVKKGLLKNLKKPCIDFCEHCVYGKAQRV